MVTPFRVGNTTSTRVISANSWNTFRGSLPNPARWQSCASVSTTHTPESHQDVAPRRVPVSDADGPQLQIRLVDAEGGLGLGELHVGAPEFLPSSQSVTLLRNT